jgi:hypothetical protein
MEVLVQASMDAQEVRMDTEVTNDVGLAIVQRTVIEAIDTDEMASGTAMQMRCGSCGRGASLSGPPGATSNGLPKAARQTAETPSVPVAPCPLLPGLLPAPGVVHLDLAPVMASPLLAGLRPGTISTRQPGAARQVVETPSVPDAPCILLPGLLPTPGVVHQDLTPVTSSPLLAGLKCTGGAPQGAACRRGRARAASEDWQGSDCYSECSTSLGSRRSSDTSDLSDTSWPFRIGSI